MDPRFSQLMCAAGMAGSLRRGIMLPAVLLVLFPLVLMVNTRLAFVAVAIVLLHQKRTREAHRTE